MGWPGGTIRPFGVGIPAAVSRVLLCHLSKDSSRPGVSLPVQALPKLRMTVGTRFARVGSVQKPSTRLKTTGSSEADSTPGNSSNSRTPTTRCGMCSLSKARLTACDFGEDPGFTLSKGGSS